MDRPGTVCGVDREQRRCRFQTDTPSGASPHLRFYLHFHRSRTNTEHSGRPEDGPVAYADARIGKAAGLADCFDEQQTDYNSTSFPRSNYASCRYISCYRGRRDGIHCASVPGVTPQTTFDNHGGRRAGPGELETDDGQPVDYIAKGVYQIVDGPRVTSSDPSAP
jgi:hypothetical protein